MSARFGKTEPRIWTQPLRPLTKKTSLGFEVIEYAKLILHIDLRPWQKWLLIHALEIMPDGSYRFRRVIVLVARQNGKTLLASVLADWWLHVDSRRHPDRVPPVKFKIVGTAQNLDIAREPWSQVRTWCNPNPSTEEEAELAITELQEQTAKVSDTNGKEYIRAKNMAHYEIRAAKNARGKPAARVLMDELREQQTWVAWNATSQTTKSFWSGQLWGISNAGDAQSVVLAKQREAGLAQIDEWDQYVAAGVTDAEAYANSHDVSVGLFEWSAPDGCALDDDDAILQANPSIGFGGMTVQSIKAEAAGMTEAGYRTECLCQWVTADIDPPFPQGAWRAGIDENSHRADGAELFHGIDTSADRTFSTISLVSKREDGSWHAEVVARRPGIDWMIRWFRERPAKHYRVAFQGRGAPVSSVAELLGELPNVETVPCIGSDVAASFGRLWDSVSACLPGSNSDATPLHHRPSPVLDEAAQSAATRQLGDGARGFDRNGSALDISPLVSVGMALWLAENSNNVGKRTIYPSAYSNAEHHLVVV